MKRIGFIILFLFLALTTVRSQSFFRPGSVVPETYLKILGSESFFSVSPIPDEVKRLMDGCSYKGMAGIGWDDLRYLRVLHRNVEGKAIVGEMVCNRSIADELMSIFMELYANSYPIERMILVDYYGGDDEASMSHNNTSCFNQRSITSGTSISKHSYGLAVDINPRYNPYYRKKSEKNIVVAPKGSIEYSKREGNFPYKIVRGDLCYKLFRKKGFRWGGDWTRYKDYQHFYK